MELFDNIGKGLDDINAWYKRNECGIRAGFTGVATGFMSGFGASALTTPWVGVPFGIGVGGSMAKDVYDDCIDAEKYRNQHGDSPKDNANLGNLSPTILSLGEKSPKVAAIRQ